MKDNQVLVRVKAVSINAGDVFAMRGNPWPIRLTAGFPKPKNYILGWDMAGVVEAAGSSVTQFRSGDEVYALAVARLPNMRAWLRINWRSSLPTSRSSKPHQFQPAQ